MKKAFVKIQLLLISILIILLPIYMFARILFEWIFSIERDEDDWM